MTAPRAAEARGGRLCIWLAHIRRVNDARCLSVAHDLNAPAMHPRLGGFEKARNWFQDLGPVSIG